MNTLSGPVLPAWPGLVFYFKVLSRLHARRDKLGDGNILYVLAILSIARPGAKVNTYIRIYYRIMELKLKIAQKKPDAQSTFHRGKRSPMPFLNALYIRRWPGRPRNNETMSGLLPTNIYIITRMPTERKQFLALSTSAILITFRQPYTDERHLQCH